MPTNDSFLVVGQGIAGTILHYSLLKKGCKAKVVDRFISGASSKAAAGIINPITGAQYVLSWQYPLLEKYFVSLYKDFENDFGVKVLNKIPIYRNLKDPKSYNQWNTKSSYPENEAYYQEILPFLKAYADHAQGNGWGKVGNSYRLDVNLMLSTYRRYLIENDLLIDETFDYSVIQSDENGIIYKDLEVDKIIFCEGYQVMNNPYFNNLPIIPSRGQVLIVENTVGIQDSISKRNQLISPWNENLLWFGATIENNNANTSIDDEVSDKLRLQFYEDFGTNPLVRQNMVGIRPTVKDRRPIVGSHVHYKRMFIMNGLGTKGASLAPYVADVLVKHVMDGKEIPIEININRFSHQSL